MMERTRGSVWGSITKYSSKTIPRLEDEQVRGAIDLAERDPDHADFLLQQPILELQALVNRFAVHPTSALVTSARDILRTKWKSLKPFAEPMSGHSKFALEAAFDLVDFYGPSFLSCLSKVILFRFDPTELNPVLTKLALSHLRSEQLTRALPLPVERVSYFWQICRTAQCSDHLRQFLDMGLRQALVPEWNEYKTTLAAALLHTEHPLVSPPVLAQALRALLDTDRLVPFQYTQWTAVRRVLQTEFEPLLAAVEGSPQFQLWT
jgi:hypothetical protein